MNQSLPGITMEQVTDPVELGKYAARQAQLERNWAWFEQHAQEIYRTHRGKCLCIAGAELFVGDTPEEAVARARTAHPDDDGRFTRYIPKERLARVYVVRRDLASV
jgi:hypothetical protein